jgi:hypothetical protein
LLEKIFNKPVDTVFDNAKIAVKKCGWTISHENRQKGQIEAKSSASLLSWGETIQIKIDSISAEKIKVVVSSSVDNQLISWGKDSQNEAQYLSILNELLKP